MGVPLTHPVVMDYHGLVRLSIETHGDLGYPHLKNLQMNMTDTPSGSPTQGAWPGNEAIGWEPFVDACLARCWSFNLLAALFLAMVLSWQWWGHPVDQLGNPHDPPKKWLELGHILGHIGAISDFQTDLDADQWLWRFPILGGTPKSSILGGIFHYKPSSYWGSPIHEWCAGPESYVGRDASRFC